MLEEIQHPESCTQQSLHNDMMNVYLLAKLLSLSSSVRRLLGFVTRLSTGDAAKVRSSRKGE